VSAPAAVADVAPTVDLWCHTCKAFVAIRPAFIRRAEKTTPVRHVTPDAWTEHRATHTPAIEGEPS
jgi:hypothetical protein